MSSSPRWPVADPIDQKIIAFLGTLLTAIRKSNGYETDAGEYVIAEDSVDAPDGATVLELIDETEETAFQAPGRRQGHLLIKVAIRFPSGTLPGVGVYATARRIFADIRRALSRIPSRQFPPGFTGLEIGGRTLIEREGGSRFLTPELRLRASFTEQHNS